VKKIIATSLVFLAVILVFARDVSAQSELSWNAGVITDKSFKFDPFLWTNGFNLDIYLSPRLSLSPELYMVLHNFDFGAFILAPGLLLNYQGPGYFFGGGITKWWILGSQVEGAPATDVMCKLNFGLVGSDIRFTLFAITPFQNFFKDTWFGATFGFYF
jgi:hypothetical protein